MTEPIGILVPMTVAAEMRRVVINICRQLQIIRTGESYGRDATIETLRAIQAANAELRLAYITLTKLVAENIIQ